MNVMNRLPDCAIVLGMSSVDGQVYVGTVCNGFCNKVFQMSDIKSLREWMVSHGIPVLLNLLDEHGKPYLIDALRRSTQGYMPEGSHEFAAVQLGTHLLIGFEGFIGRTYAKLGEKGAYPANLVSDTQFVFATFDLTSALKGGTVQGFSVIQSEYSRRFRICTQKDNWGVNNAHTVESNVKCPFTLMIYTSCTATRAELQLTFVTLVHSYGGAEHFEVEATGIECSVSASGKLNVVVAGDNGGSMPAYSRFNMRKRTETVARKYLNLISNQYGIVNGYRVR